jgi:nucleotide-binding universal stress UspA family protein
MQRSTDPRLDTILIAVDFNKPSVSAAEWTSRNFSNSNLAFVSVVEPPPAPPSLAQRFPSTDKLVDDAKTEAMRKLKQLTQRIAPKAEVEVRSGRPTEEILKLADAISADLIVVGRQEVGSAGWARVGAIAQRLLRNARTPILVVAGQSTDAPAAILAGVDDSPMTEVVLEWARILSDHFSSKATALHVLTSARTDEEAAGARAWLEQRIDEAGAKGKIRPDVVSGARRAAEAVIAEARSGAGGLVVVGSHGAGSMSGESFGSVAESVVVSAPCPVFVAVP